MHFDASFNKCSAVCGSTESLQKYRCDYMEESLIFRAMQTAHTRYCSRIFFGNRPDPSEGKRTVCVFLCFRFEIAKNSCGPTFIGMLFRLHRTTLYLNGWCYVLCARLQSTNRHYQYLVYFILGSYWLVFDNTLITHKNKNHV